MANVKRYKIEWNDIAEAVFDIDHDIMTDEELHEINNFFSNSKWRIKSKGSLVNAVLCMLGALVIHEQFEHDYFIEDLIKQFDWDAGKGMEGWPPMDGSHGITIVDVTDIEYSWYEMDAMEIPHPDNQPAKAEQ
ncbi:DUF2528 family protein [Lelliottia nimipressuralis]|uniref:DUF2528 family protein n=1 Tax=Lelliottia nimipressuralis TaxID=69220 RepID=UPI0028972E6E|nr:DUF2528 family protein [Lelliottia nimipressuralis]